MTAEFKYRVAKNIETHGVVIIVVSDTIGCECEVCGKENKPVKEDINGRKYMARYVEEIGDPNFPRNEFTTITTQYYGHTDYKLLAFVPITPISRKTVH